MLFRSIAVQGIFLMHSEGITSPTVQSIVLDMTTVGTMAGAYAFAYLRPRMGYATMLALMILPQKACENLQVLSAQGFEGEYGFFEAIDYTASRVQRGKTNSIVYSFMVHHQSMSLLSLAYLLLNRPMQQRFEAEPLFQATLLLLQIGRAHV